MALISIAVSPLYTNGNSVLPTLKNITCDKVNMRNIFLSNFESLCLKNLVNCEAFCHYRQAIYAYDGGKVVKSLVNGEEVIFNLTENLYPATDENDIPKALEISYSCEKDLLYIIFYNGDIVSLQENETGSESIVGTVEGGIKAAQWSPEKKVIAIVTGNDSVIVMTDDFDPISEVDLHGNGFGEKQFITVGWGKKETQFRGSEGKFKATDKKIEECEISDKKIQRTKIAWRGDAEYFVISSINPDTSRRYLRIFSKNGILQYTSEDFLGLEHSLDWSPSGNLIASSQVLPNKYVICFFEKNGLKHGEFTLPQSHQEINVSDVLWNGDARILALLITKISNESSVNNNKYIQLYTVNNYHWYCKYTINFECDSVLLHFQWDSQKYNVLYVVLKKGNKIYLNKYAWLWTVHKSKGSSQKDESLVAVIDGCKLKLSSFNRGIIPPPMSTYEILLPCPINSVSFAPNIQDVFSSNDLCLLLTNNSLLIYRSTDNGSKGMNYELFGEIKDFCMASEVCANVQWVDTNTFMLSLVKVNESKSVPALTVLNVNFDAPGIDFNREDINLESTVAFIRASEHAILLHDNNGQLYSFSKCKKELENLNSKNKALIDLEVRDSENGRFLFFSLDNLNKFYVNNNNILSNVLSFHIHENFILLTTMKHELLCLNTDMDITSETLSGVYSRRVERGSRIVTSVQKDMKVILQMPRGNLECIQPRPLSLFVLGKYLDSLKYFSAFDLMRKQRINVNLLYDHNPDLFSKNVNIFLDQIKDMQWISLFLSDLSDEDFTKTMYSSICDNKNTRDNCTDSKIDTVCGLIEKAIEERTDSDRFILPVLTCYIKRGRTEFLERALLKLTKLREKELSGQKPAVTFDEAFKYILYLIDVEELYKVALGMYDFDLVLIVASKSQKDPKEYLPFLSGLKQLEPNYQKFKIDKYLKRYKKALTHLIKCEGDDTFNECINFIQTHKLYKCALKLISENTDLYKSVCMCYGDELMRAHSYEEAGIMYSNAGRYENAVTAYRKSGNWQEVLFCSKELKLDENELRDLYLDLALELCELKCFKEAATVYLDYLKDVPESLRALSKGKFFAEAYRIAYLHKSADLITRIVLPEILDQANHMHLHITNMKETFIGQKNRLKVVREQKMKASDDKNEFDDLYSETNSVITQSVSTSRSTNRTFRSAKNKRKQERKLLSLKEGSPYEDLALVISLHNIVTNSVSLKPEMKELNKFLVKIGDFGKAEILQSKFDELLKIIEVSKADIWTPDLLNRRQFYGPGATSNEISAMFMRSENVTPVLLNSKYAVPPETENNVKWELEILTL